MTELSKMQSNSGYRAGSNELRLQDSGEFLYRVIENADGVPFHLIFGSQTEEGYYLNTGAGIKELIGVAAEDLTEKVFNTMIIEIVPFSEDIPADLLESRRKLINGQIKSYKADYLVKTADGEMKWIREASLPLTDEETGKVTGKFGILCDITGGKLNLDRIKEKEYEFDRLKSDLLQSISHEIRTPLNVIVGFSTLLGEHIDIPARRKEYLEIITRNSDHLLEILDDIVEISKIDSKMIRIRKDKVNLNSLLRRVYDQFWTEASGKGVLLSMEPDHKTGEAYVYTDLYKLTEVLRNLVDNALKFTSEGRVEFGFSIREGKIEFYVSDTGSGIPFEHQARIFNRFFKGDSTFSPGYNGTGMGLPISKAYVELLGGEIWFNSQPGGGSVFRFTLPYVKADNNSILSRMLI